jgi:hypothetical protein
MGLKKRFKKLKKKVDKLRTVGDYKIGIKLKPFGKKPVWPESQDELERRWSE